MRARQMGSDSIAAGCRGMKRSFSLLSIYLTGGLFLFYFQSSSFANFLAFCLSGVRFLLTVDSAALLIFSEFKNKKPV